MTKRTCTINEDVHTYLTHGFSIHNCNMDLNVKQATRNIIPTELHDHGGQRIGNRDTLVAHACLSSFTHMSKGA
jgi:hypothetical protein